MFKKCFILVYCYQSAHSFKTSSFLKLGNQNTVLRLCNSKRYSAIKLFQESLVRKYKHRPPKMSKNIFNDNTVL